MFHLLSKYLGVTLRVFLILITLFMLFACASHSSNSSSQAYNGRIYKVNKGDTLYSIALKYGLYYKDLASINGIVSPYSIYAGQELRIDPNKAKAAAVNSSKTTRTPDSGSKNGTKRASSPPADTSFYSTPKWQWPAQGKLIAQFQGESGLNKGIDLGGKLGEPVLAAASGQVLYAGSGLSGYGKLLIIKHNETFLSAYAHNSELLVKEGDLIKAGQKIADMGSSGTDRVKLHFEIRSDGNPVDPLKYLPKR